MTVEQSSAGTQAGNHARGDTAVDHAVETTPDTWSLTLQGGLVLHVPPSLHALSTYVLLEQERWFEPEMSLLPLLLEPGANALDIGANHGVYALEIARCSGNGHVWAFEPTAAPRASLLRSVQANGLSDRVTVVDAGLAEAPGHASFAVHDNSELNSRSGMGTQREEVRLDALDRYLDEHAGGVTIDFVKLDAEGDEARVLAGGARFFATQSPAVLFELKHGNHVNTELIGLWQYLGYDIFRWSAELALLLPFDVARDETAFALNLVAVRPAVQDRLAARGLLATAEALATTAAPVATGQALAAWCAQPALRAADNAPYAWPEVIDADYLQALGRVASAHCGAGLRPAERVALLRAARDGLLPVLAGGAGHGPEAWLLIVHCHQALGEPHAAVELAAQLLARWPAAAVVTMPFVPPQRADLGRLRSTPAASWLHQVLGEFVAVRSAWSSYFMPPVPERWAGLLDHPDHSADVERRFMLSHMVQDRIAPIERLRLLPDPAHTRNPQLWQALIQATRAMGRDDAPQTAATPHGGAEALLATLPVAAVHIVDVGASPLGAETEPYAPLVRAGRAHVTGFEPDAQALAQLQRQFPHAQTHRFLPHFVGDGSPAVFHETEWPLTASLFEPNRRMLDHYQHLGELVREKARHDVQTARLDDLIARGGMDVLKIDVQGAERLVFDGAPQRLDECLVVWTEVEFVPLYIGQPLFGDIDARLRKHGLQFLCFAGLAPRALASWPQGAPQPQRPQQLWADAIYVPKPERVETLDAAAAARLALVAHHMLAAQDLCHAALLQHDRVSGADYARRYLAALGATPAAAR